MSSYRSDAMYRSPIIPNNNTNMTNAAGSLRQAGAASLSPSQYPSNKDPSALPPHSYPVTQTNDPDYDIYSRAISVSSPRVGAVEGDVDPNVPPVVRRKVVRRVEVPFTRAVKVPTTTTQLVPSVVEQRVPVKKLVAVPGFKLVDEEYTEYEEREAVREKEVWVKKIVPERYIEKVPVQRVRQVQKPTTLIKEVDTYEVVQVPTTKKVTVDGYRIDHVQDSKLVEVEEYQDYELRPQPVGTPQISSTTELGRLPQSRLSRNIGHQVFSPDHPALNQLDHDDEVANSAPANTTYSNRGPFNNSAPLPSTVNISSNSVNASGMAGQQQPSSVNNKSFYRPSSPTSRNLNIHGTSSWSASQQDYGAFQPAAGVTVPLNDPRSVSGAGQYRKPAIKSVDDGNATSGNKGGPAAGGGPSELTMSLGLSLDDTHTRHTDGTGVQVTSVVRGAAAARAGLQPHDIITSVNGVPSSTVDEFHQLAARSPGPLALTINRDGRRNITLTLYR